MHACTCQQKNCTHAFFMLPAYLMDASRLKDAVLKLKENGMDWKEMVQDVVNKDGKPIAPSWGKGLRC